MAEERPSLDQDRGRSIRRRNSSKIKELSDDDGDDDPGKIAEDNGPADELKEFAHIEKGKPDLDDPHNGDNMHQNLDRQYLFLGAACVFEIIPEDIGDRCLDQDRRPCAGSRYEIAG